MGGEWARLCHELDTPLGVARMALAIQLERLDELRERLVLDPAHPAAALLADVLESAGLAHGGLERALAVLADQKRRVLGTMEAALPRPIGLAQLALEAARLPLARFAQVRVELVIGIDPALQIIGEPAAWHQVLGNLFMNSILHGFEGRPGGRVWLASEVSADLQSVRLHYRDDGRGVPDAVLRQLFRGRVTTGAARGCEGLGLTIVHDIVRDRLRGSITVHPCADGAAFVIDVPRDGDGLRPVHPSTNFASASTTGELR